MAGIKFRRLWCRSFGADAGRLPLHARPYNLGNLLRQLTLQEAEDWWSMGSLREQLVKIGAKVVSPRALRDLPAGRGRGAAADVCRHSVADRPTACTPCAGMRGGGSKCRMGEGRIRGEVRFRAS